MLRERRSRWWCRLLQLVPWRAVQWSSQWWKLGGGRWCRGFHPATTALPCRLCSSLGRSVCGSATSRLLFILPSSLNDSFLIFIIIQVTRHVRGFGNFLFVQFASEPERDSAVARGQNLILGSGVVLLSVQPLTAALGAHLGFEEALQAAHRHGTSIGGGVPLSAGGLRHRSSAPGLLSPPPSLGGRAYNPNRSVREPSRRHVSICKKIMRAVFGW